MEELFDYLDKEKIVYSSEDSGSARINNQTFELIYPDNGLLFDENFHLICQETYCDNYIFKFGGKWYHTPKGSERDPKLLRVKYLGVGNFELENDSFLGVRGGFELLNGSRLYQDWVKKAKFLGVKNLGICEKNTLAGALKFQNECVSSGIKPIIGETITVLEDKNDTLFDVKLFVKDEQGWQNILTLNKSVLVDNGKFTTLECLLSHLKGLILVLDPKSVDFNIVCNWWRYGDVYYQLDTVVFEDQQKDEWYLKNLKKFKESKLKPTSITDAFYLDQEDSFIKKKLNLIKKENDPNSNNQYFKSKDQYCEELSLLFNPEDSSFSSYLLKSINNEKKIAESCKFKIETGNRHLPKYVMTSEEFKKFSGDNLAMFHSLLKEGMQKKGFTGKEEYENRLLEETEVIEFGNVVDYFLITRDIINFARKKGYLSGVARGSAGGALTSYLLGITQIDPLKYGLLFSRFLNKSRAQVSLPDIDNDFPSKVRGEIKEYMENRFGITQVCSVGTYTALKLRGAIKDLARLDNIPFEDVNRVTLLIGEEDKSLEDLFKKSCKLRTIKNFIQQYPDLINSLELVLGQPKASSIHACAVMIFPSDKEQFSWVPVRMQEGSYVSEWEGNELDSAGFLKQDILGVLQLDKFTDILELIKENGKQSVDIYNLDFDDEKVYKYFRKGWNSDVFHFGSRGLTGYCKELQPENINDLIAAISLYRPGAMENNFHNEYILRKNGERDVEYFIGSEGVLKDTYGVFVYQEQIMKLCQVLGGLTMVEADDVRKAMVKKKYEALHKYKERFLKYYHETFNVTEEYANSVWDAIDKASTYLFNKSHAAAYTITGYISQYLKVHYPIEYWITAFKYAKEEDYAEYISEINKTGKIKISSSDINKSGIDTSADFKTNTIVWSLKAVKNVGEIAATQIIEDREKNGEYFSFDEFLDRNKYLGSKVNKRVIEHLVISGAFDSIEEITKEKDRKKLIQKLYSFLKFKREDSILKDQSVDENWFWLFNQKILSNIAFFDYEEITKPFIEDEKYYYHSYEDFQTRKTGNSPKATISGYVQSHEEKHSKNGIFAKIILECNYEFIDVIIWNEQYEEFIGCDFNKKILVVNGVIVKDKKSGKNFLQSNSETKLYILE